MLDLSNERSQTVSQSVASVTIAHNAAEVLPRQMEALLLQTRPLQEIIVVDNASTDGTAAILSQQYPQVTVLRMNENVGAAGAWAAGLSYAALQKRHDWVWTFDDDSIPQNDALMMLMQGLGGIAGSATKVGMAAPMPVHRKTNTYYPPYFWRDGFVRPSDEQIRAPLWFADLTIVSGSLVHRGAVEEIGVPRADFFMDVFDLEYCLRMRSHGYQIAVISRAEMSHEVGNARKINLLGYKRLWTNQPPWREYYISRNLTYLGWWLQPNNATKRSIARYLVVHAAQVLLFSTKKLRCLTRIIQGFYDGRHGRLGIRHKPALDSGASISCPVNPTNNIEANKA